MELREMKELAISALVLAVAFSVALNGGLSGIERLNVIIVAASLVTVSLGFLLHELGHRFTARRFGCYAEYRMWSIGLALALLFSFLGFVFAAPGAVMIHARADLWGRSAGISRKREGIISLSGPAINVALAVLFVLLSFAFPAYASILRFGASVNIWLALFNILPIPPLDGSKVFGWDRRIWLATAAFVALLWAIL